MDDDRISSPPDYVTHHIFSFIPDIREGVSTSSLSKSWLRTWRSFKITDFDQCLILPSSALESINKGLLNEYGEGFVRFVDGALVRSQDGMPRFRLRATAEMAPRVDRWRFCRHMDKVSPYTCAVRFTLSLFQNASARWLRKFLRRCSTTFTCLESTVYVNQSICEAFAKKEEYPECCSGDIKCFCHRLKDAKIESVAGIQYGGPLDMYALCSWDLCPNLSFGPDVWLKLQWWN
ncbi:hypothetical protein CRG98_016058 [Punica granatum]|uniref:F-box domain-containing protein n=1 Tax=Punica granatum TaxID=22663 RepID=A0A2I0K5U2_PUNGR|nr:hypothetical protein CRG98_016058 [Punica granatum]